VIGSLIAFLHCKRPALFQLPTLAVVMLVLTMIAGYSVETHYPIIFASTATMVLLLGVSSLERRL